jgi:DNA anti-recombination protein RmuC
VKCLAFCLETFSGTQELEELHELKLNEDKARNAQKQEKDKKRQEQNEQLRQEMEKKRRRLIDQKDSRRKKLTHEAGNYEEQLHEYGYRNLEQLIRLQKARFLQKRIREKKTNLDEIVLTYDAICKAFIQSGQIEKMIPFVSREKFMSYVANLPDKTFM